jgi:putative methionine-R-sulfoxide reductase with GAF domain
MRLMICHIQNMQSTVSSILTHFTQLRKWQGPYSYKEESWVTGVHSGEEGTLLIIFQFNKIILNYFYCQL